MRRLLPLLAMALLVCLAGPADTRGAAGASKVYLPLLINDPPSPAALPPEQLGTPLPVSGGPAAFFADQIYEPGGALAVWLPPGQAVLRGVFFLNGSANKPSPSDPDWRNQVAQQRILAARQVASLWGFALVTGAVWDIPQPAQYLDGALRGWAAATGHAELAHAPLAIDGGSRFSNFCRSEAATFFTGRIIACTIIVGGAQATSAANIGVPSLVIVGERDSGASVISGSVLPARQSGSLLAGAMMWKIDHKCDRCQDLSWPYLDRAIALRLPAKVDPRSGPVALRELAEGQGYLGDLAAWSGPWAYAAAPSAPRGMAWLPDASTALIWRAFVLNGPPLRMSAPTSPYQWGSGFSQKPSSLRAGKPLTLEASIGAPISGALTFYDGDRPLGAGMRSADGKKLSLAGVQLLPGMHSLWVLGEAGPVSWPAGLIVLP